MPTNDETHDLAKVAAASLFGMAAYNVTSSILKNNLDEPDTKYTKLVNGLGVFALAGTAGALVGQHVKKEYDDYLQGYRELRGIKRDMTQSK